MNQANGKDEEGMSETVEKRYFSVVTDGGAGEMMAALADGRKINITDFVVGDGDGAYYEPDTSMTAIKREVWRGQIDACYISPESENILIITAIIPGTAGGFTIREMGVLDSNGKLIAVCNTPETPKVKITDGVVHEMNVSIEIVLVNGDAVQLVIDPNVVTATKADVQAVQTDLDGLKEKVKNMETVEIKKSLTLLAEGWQGEALPYVQEVTVEELAAEARVDITTIPDTTAEQMDAITAGIIRGGEQEQGKFTVKAFGEKPGIDIPILAIITQRLVNTLSIGGM